MKKLSNIKTKSIFKKAKKDDQYAQISNDLINDRRLSYKAMGILTYILSKPDDWEVWISDLEREGDKEKSVRSGINELITYKYMQRYRVFDVDTKKVNHWETLVSEEPFKEDELIWMVREKYYHNSDGSIMLHTTKYGNTTRSIPLVEFREVELLSQKGKVGKKIEKNLLSQNLQVGFLQVGNEGQQIQNTTKTDLNQNLSTSSDILKQIFEESICKLRKTTGAKFEKIVKTYDPGMVFQVMQECMRSKTYSYKKFEIAFINYLERGCKTREDVAVSAAAYRKELKITEKQENGKPGFHNFEARDYNYDNLEKMFDGEMEYNLENLYNNNK
jgi:hypothetical protein